MPSHQPPGQQRAALKALAHQTAIACLNVLVYGGILVVAMSGVAALDAGSVAVTAINDQGNFVHLAYYPNTQVFCSAERWSEGRRIMGDELLGRLNEQYDFNL